MITCEPEFQHLLDAAATSDWYPELTKAVNETTLSQKIEAINYFNKSKSQLGHFVAYSYKWHMDIYFSRIIGLCQRTL